MLFFISKKNWNYCRGVRINKKGYEHRWNGESEQVNIKGFTCSKRMSKDNLSADTKYTTGNS